MNGKSGKWLSVALLGTLWFSQPVCSQDRVHRQIYIDSAPLGVKVYLERAEGLQYLGLSGTKIDLDPPCERDSSGKFLRYLNGNLVLDSPFYERLQISVNSSEWQESHLPRQGRYEMIAHRGLRRLLDYCQVYPAEILVFLSLLGLAGWSLRRITRRAIDPLEVFKKAGDPLLGKSLGDYRVLDQLGKGGMGTVYRVTNGCGQEFAAKVVHPDPTAPQFDSRFRREATVLGQLSHPNLVGLVEFGESRGILFCVMELVKGETLAERMRPGGMSWREVWEIVVPLLSGLIYAHSKGVVHRDLKPANIMIGPEKVIKIVDFGLAREQSLAAITMTGNTLGTPLYVAPEQLSAHRGDIEPRTDQYSLGIILFEMLTGRAPFQSKDPNELISMHLRMLPPDLRSLRPDLSDELGHVIARTLLKEVDRRFPDLTAFREALEAVPEITEPDGRAKPPVDSTLALGRRRESP